eukprot:TRINITY_DN5368_c1_g1_i1.p1 TRINITY_DN5368_c1_g1~~TRINITY_DN5368_c1_g1_i1.p1  ORF type:complete len:967 (+),score=342.26 TRINITY_DN5368_c1_g1_i1:65-2902(+)
MAALGEGWKATNPDAAEAAVQILDGVKDAASVMEKLRTTADKGKLGTFLYFLRNAISSDSDFAEEFLKEGGLEVVSQCLMTLTGNQQLELLRTLREVLLLENAMDTFTSDKTIVNRVYKLLTQAGNIAKQVLDILIVTVYDSDRGLTLVHDTAMKTQKGEHPYAPLASVLKGTAENDLTVLPNLLTFMNATLSKVKTLGAEAVTSVPELLRLWQRCGLVSQLERLNDVEDEEVESLLLVFQKLTGHAVPMGKYAAQQLAFRAKELQNKQRLTAENLVLLQRQQGKAALVQGELTAAGALMAELRSRLSNEDVQMILSSKTPIAPPVVGNNPAAKEYVHAVFKSIALQPAFKGKLQEILGTKRVITKGGGKAGKTGDPFGDADTISSSSGRAVRPPRPYSSSASSDTSDTAEHTGSATSSELPDDATTESSDRPPSDDDDEVNEKQPDTLTNNDAKPQSQQLQSQPQAQQQAQQQPQQPVPPGKAAPKPVAKPAPPKPPTKKPGPKKPGAKKAALKLKYNGPTPTKKMRVMHWEKIMLYKESPPSLWHKVHQDLGGEIDWGKLIDWEEFESMFSAKDKVTGPETTTVKAERPELVDAKKFQNLSIMLHKMPPIPELQQAIGQLDNSVISLEMLEQILGQMPNEDDETKWQLMNNKIPVEEYEPPEQFFAMVFSSVALSRRLKSWQVTLEWQDKVKKAERPIKLVHEACDAVLKAKHLPLVLGIVLGFGNCMNAGHKQRENACGFAVTTLSKLEFTKSTTKQNLLQYVVNVCNQKDPDSIRLGDELAPCKAASGMKTDDMDKAVDEVVKELSKFKSSVADVKKKLEAAGISEDQDPFVKQMTEFYKSAEVQSKEVEQKVEQARAAFDRVLEFWPLPMGPGKKASFEDYFPPLLQFLEKFQLEASDILKERKRLEKKGIRREAKKGTTEGADMMDKLANEIKQELVQS